MWRVSPYRDAPLRCITCRSWLQDHTSIDHYSQLKWIMQKTLNNLTSYKSQLMMTYHVWKPILMITDWVSIWINVNLCYLEPTKLWKIPSPHIHINNEPLRQVSVEKYLGMYIDENLHWDHHIDTFVKKISSKIGILRSLRKLVPIDTLKLEYNAIVLPPLRLCSRCVWCSIWDQ